MTDSRCSTATTDLLPCPFCGGTNIKALAHLDWVACDDCGAALEDSEPSARELWNRRAPQPVSDAQPPTPWMPSIQRMPHAAQTLQDPSRQELIESIKFAAGELSAHIDTYHDFDYAPHQVPPELEELRRLQHHLEGSLIDSKGYFTPAQPTQGGDQGEAVAWRYRWKDDDVWDAVPHEDMLPTNKNDWVIEPLFAAPQPASNAYDVLPCDVHLPVNTYIRRGVPIATLMTAIKAREKFPLDATQFQALAPPAMVKGTVYQLENFGPAEYLGLDVYHGETTHQFRTRDGIRYIKPERLASSLSSTQRGSEA